MSSTKMAVIMSQPQCVEWYPNMNTLPTADTIGDVLYNSFEKHFEIALHKYYADHFYFDIMDGPWHLSGVLLP